MALFSRLKNYDLIYLNSKFIILFELASLLQAKIVNKFVIFLKRVIKCIVLFKN